MAFSFLQVKEKKYETVQTTSRMLESTLKILSQTSAVGMAARRNSKDKSSSGSSRSGSRTGSLKKRKNSPTPSSSVHQTNASVNASANANGDRHAEFLSKRQRDVEKGAALIRKNSGKKVNFNGSSNASNNGAKANVPGAVEGEEEKLLPLAEAVITKDSEPRAANYKPMDEEGGVTSVSELGTSEHCELIRPRRDLTKDGGANGRCPEVHVNAAFPTSDTLGSLTMSQFD